MQLIYFDRFVLKEMEMLPGTKCCRRVRDRIYIHRFTRWKKVKQITESCLQTTEQTSFSNKLLTNAVNNLVIVKVTLGQTKRRHLSDCSTKNITCFINVKLWVY